MKLLSATPSPYARKARIALHEKGLAFELGDIAVGCLLGYVDLRYPKLPWRTHAHLDALSERLSRRPSFRQTVPVAQTITSKGA